MIKQFLLAFLVVFFYNNSFSQTAPPRIEIQNPNQTLKLTPLKITNLDIDITVVGFNSETKMTLTFYNPNNRVLAGDLYFPLPEGATVSGYGLDINGEMVDGVVVSKDKGRRVFEKIVRQGIDPGLVEKVKGNNFKTRVFPIPSKGTRTIKIIYVSDIQSQKKSHSFRLPLNFSDKIKKAHIKMEVIKSFTKPKITKSPVTNFQFKKWRDSFVAEQNLNDVLLNEDLVIALPNIEKNPVYIEKFRDGVYYFAIHDFPSIPELKEKDEAKTIRILWDASGSREKSNHEKEFDFLRDYFKNIESGTVHVKVALFRNVITNYRDFKIENGNIEFLIRELKTIDYDGGTQLGSITRNLKADVDFTFLFTDGISNFGKENPGNFNKPVYIFSADSGTNHSFLKSLSNRTGGEYFNLNRIQNKDIIRSLSKETFGFIKADFKGGEVVETYSRGFQPVYNRFTFVGKLFSSKSKITLNFGTNGNITTSKTYELNMKDANEGNLITRVWATKKLEDLSLNSDKNREKIVALGKQYNMVTEGTSLIVLENLEQYLEHEITPPESLPQMRKQYLLRMEQRQNNKKKIEEQKIASVLKMWEKRVEWWNKDFKYDPNIRIKNKDKKEAGGHSSEPVEEERNEVQSNKIDTLFNDRERANRPRRPDRSDRLEGESDTAYVGPMNDEDEDSPRTRGFSQENDEKKGKKRNGTSMEPEKVIEIQTRPENTPYLTALEEVKDKKNLFKTYMLQKKVYGKSPAFFLDCADFFFKKKEYDLGLQILSNIAEMELENAALLRVLAHRLKQIGELDLSILIFEEVKKLRPEEPQSYRDLALALSERADIKSNKRKSGTNLVSKQEDLKRAVDLLNHVVMNKWDRFAGIEVIALMELNRLIPKGKSAGIEKFTVDKRLIKLLDLDVRIVLSWDADLTDIDLWVTEPSGEKAYYSNNRTRIGGLVSRDFTQGYGPEEYLIKKAMKGQYKIEANFYGSSAPKIIGAVTLQAEIFINYGRKNERKKSITLRLVNKKDNVYIGTITY